MGRRAQLAYFGRRMAFTALAMPAGLLAQDIALPVRAADPLPDSRSADPVLSLVDSAMPRAPFLAVMNDVLRRHPSLAGAQAAADAAEAQLAGAREAARPVVDVNIQSFRVISRDFSGDPQNVLERTRPSRRTDGSLTINQTVFDFGANLERQAAARARITASIADIESSAAQVALELVVSWYDVAAYRALDALARSFLASENEARLAVRQRIDAGIAAPVDLARIDSAIARNKARIADFARRLGAAEARFQALTGRAAPAGLQRVPRACPFEGAQESAVAAAMHAPPVVSADAAANAAERDARAVTREARPVFTAGIDAGRFGIFETPFDYDVRGRIGVRVRLFGGTEARLAEARALARQARARADQVRGDAGRDAATAWSDVAALQEAQDALEAAYLASRMTRDGVAERFRVARGSIFDVLTVEEELFQSAVSYLQGLSELDTTRYILLARTGRLLNCLQVDAPLGDRNR
jgi:outer membrane protein, adhesin transport system